MKLRLLGAVCAYCLSVVFVTNVNASLVEIEWENGLSGNSDLTRDALTGFEWFDINLTFLTSNQEIDTATQSGGIYEGFRRATTDELIQFLSHAGVSVNKIASNIGEADAALSFMDKTAEGGEIDPTFGNVVAKGRLLDADGRQWLSILHAYPNDNPIWPGYTIFDPDFVSTGGDGRDADAGHWLLRETAVVPIPPALYLFGTGLIGLVGMARRKAA